MPIYEFRCPSCKKEFELFIRSSKAPSPPCPTCGGPATRKVSVFSAQTGAASGGGPAPMPGMCGCGKRMGSCGMDQG